MFIFCYYVSTPVTTTVRLPMQSTNFANKWHCELSSGDKRKLNRFFKVIIWLAITAGMIQLVSYIAQPWITNISHQYTLLRLSIGLMLFSAFACLNACIALIFRRLRQ